MAGFIVTIGVLFVLGLVVLSMARRRSTPAFEGRERPPEATDRLPPRRPDSPDAP